MKTAVIIPAYNAEPYLAEAVRSVQAQTNPPAALVVVDDGSTDRTAEVARALGSGITYVRQENGGPSAARNHGASLLAADIQWLLFLDADDRLLPCALDLLHQRRAQIPAAKVIYGQAECFHEDGARPKWLHGDARSEGPVPAAARASFWKSALATPGVALIERQLFQEVGGFAEYKFVEDRDFWMKAGSLVEFAYVPQPVMQRRLHGANASRAKSWLRIQATRAQLDYPAWLAQRGLASPLPDLSASHVLQQNLRRALEERQFEAVRWLLQEAQRRRLQLPHAPLAHRLAHSPAWWRHLELAVRQRCGMFP